jgi:hypothetical protein
MLNQFAVSVVPDFASLYQDRCTRPGVTPAPRGYCSPATRAIRSLTTPIACLSA